MNQILLNSIACGAGYGPELSVILFVFFVLPTLAAIGCSVALVVQGLRSIYASQPGSTCVGAMLLISVLVLWMPIAYVLNVPAVPKEPQNLRQLLILIPLASIPLEFFVFLIRWSAPRGE